MEGPKSFKIRKYFWKQGLSREKVAEVLWCFQRFLLWKHTFSCVFFYCYCQDEPEDAELLSDVHNKMTCFSRKNTNNSTVDVYFFHTWHACFFSVPFSPEEQHPLCIAARRNKTRNPTPSKFWRKRSVICLTVEASNNWAKTLQPCWNGTTRKIQMVI